jgi:hypothetical protein
MSRPTMMTCRWCKATYLPKATGRLPRWCSARCRRRAWEQKRAAESGLVAVEVVRETVVEHRGRERQPRGGEWAKLLKQLSRQLDEGRVYDRDLADLRAALRMVVESSARRRGPRPSRRARTRPYAPWQLYK